MYGNLQDFHFWCFKCVCNVREGVSRRVMSYITRVTMKLSEARPLCETLLRQHYHHRNIVHGFSHFSYTNRQMQCPISNSLLCSNIMLLHCFHGSCSTFPYKYRPLSSNIGSRFQFLCHEHQNGPHISQFPMLLNSNYSLMSHFNPTNEHAT